MSHYHCLIASLPDLNWGELPKNLSLLEFLDEVEGQVSQGDRHILRLFRLQFDNENLLRFLLKQESGEFLQGGNFSSSFIEELVAQVKAGDRMVGAAELYYLEEFIAYYFEYADAPNTGPILQDRLNALYYEYALNCSNEFVRNWFEFNMNLRNLLSAQTCKKYRLDVKPFLVGENEVSAILAQTNARDFGLSGVFDYADEVLRLGEENNFLERENKIDLLKWRYLDEQVFFHYFSMEKVFSYMVMLETLERWQRLTQENGEQRFKEMSEQLQNSFEFPATFLINKRGK